LDVLDLTSENLLPEPLKTNKELLNSFEKNLAAGTKALEHASDDILDRNWEMRNGDQVYLSASKSEVLRMSISQLIHHRAQLGVYLRLLNIPIPGSYGPSADEMG
jgi:uncharacterized damage-inducible protein DinB